MFYLRAMFGWKVPSSKVYREIIGNRSKKDPPTRLSFEFLEKRNVLRIFRHPVGRIRDEKFSSNETVTRRVTKRYALEGE